jgi:hypothetical protein
MQLDHHVGRSRPRTAVTGGDVALDRERLSRGTASVTAPHAVRPVEGDEVRAALQREAVRSLRVGRYLDAGPAPRIRASARIRGQGGTTGTHPAIVRAPVKNLVRPSGPALASAPTRASLGPGAQKVGHAVRRPRTNRRSKRRRAEPARRPTRALPQQPPRRRCLSPRLRWRPTTDGHQPTPNQPSPRVHTSNTPHPPRPNPPPQTRRNPAHQAEKT